MDSGANQGSESGLERLVAMVIRLADGHLFAKRLAPIPAPRFHTATEAAWRHLYDDYSEFLAAFRVAAAKLKAGDRAAPFPTGSFPPGLPFVTA